MIWLNIFEGRLHGGVGGAERLYNLPVQDFGLQVKDVVGAIAVTGRGTSNAKVRLRFDDGATNDLNALVGGTGTDVIGSSGSPVAVPSTLPGTIKGSATGYWLPYLRFQVGITGLATDEWVQLAIFAGGKPY
jgi:hypothetical protein